MIDQLRFFAFDTIKKIIFGNEVIYKLWLKYYVEYKKGYKKKLPAETDNFYFDGYPRSGNTYTKGLLSYAFPDIHGTSHLHSEMGIQIALRHKTPIFIIIRKPFDAVASNMFRKVENRTVLSNNKLADLLLKQYIRYYTYVNKHITKIRIIRFESVIQNQGTFLKKISEIFEGKISAKSMDDFDTVIQQFETEMKKREKKKRDGISSLPNDIRQQFKNNNDKSILNSQYFEKAHNLYEELSQNDIISPNVDQ